MKEVSYSRVSTYRDCPYQHYLRYVERLESIKPVRPLSFGSDMHKLLEFKNKPDELAKEWKNIEDTYYNMAPQHQEALGPSYIEDIRSIFTDYLEVHHGQPEPTESEVRFSIPFARIGGEEIAYVGVIDEVYLDTNQIGEHKTFNMKPDMLHLAMNTQVCLYSMAMRKLYGKYPDTVIWDYIKSTPASTPTWLESSKRFSQAKSQSITPMSWRRACMEMGIVEEDVVGYGDVYEPNISNFFFKVTLGINKQMVKKVWDDFKQTAIDLIKNGETNKVQNVTRDCTWCSYKDICYTEFTGGDVEYTKSKDFIRRT